MSNILPPEPATIENQTSSIPGVEHIIQARRTELGGAVVRRVLPYFKRRMVGPWIFFDHLGPADIPPGRGMDILAHPHINLATVSYLFEGQILHRDSLGYAQPIEPGAINLMVAGRGITHSERSAPELRASGYRLHGLQLWLALPDEHEETEPAFYHYPAGELPGRTVAAGVKMRVLIGSGCGLNSPVKTFSPTFYAEAWLEAGSRFTFPVVAQEQAIYLASGAISLNGQAVPAYTMAVCRSGQEALIEAGREPARMAVIGGDPVGHRHIYWNFVSSRAERIEQAKQDWQAGRFPMVPGETEFIPLPAAPARRPPPNYL